MAAAAASPAEAPAVDKSVFGRVADFAEQAVACEDIASAPFLEACAAYREGLCSMGPAAQVAVSDFDGNFTVVQAFFQKDSGNRATWKALCLDSGAPRVQLKWLLWGLEFFMTYLLKLWEGDWSGASTAYGLTLTNHHSFMQRLGFKALLVTLPGRDSIRNQRMLCPDHSGKEPLGKVVDRDVSRMVQGFLPAVCTALKILESI
eukprot:CAMPEP_0183441120 /NCGR_PEP_ID=MMETSP0370-20130417/83790_1 /TAXON_ID=268820 /ORGANISM="Peridinium aciculiferum, Strain PAER-2" /LENGTH=203 /DNA_ID=CAMNT_0025630219 /DNA_START=62 /DNA_END=673 /DNA_ORIENTATION=+